MVQIYTLDGVVGTLLTEFDVASMIEIQDIHGKKKYFIPSKKSAKPKFSKNELFILLGSGKSINEIAQYYQKSLSWVNSKLINFFGTSSHKAIMTKIGETKIGESQI